MITKHTPIPIFDEHEQIIGLRRISYLTFQEALDNNIGVRLLLTSEAISLGLVLGLLGWILA